MFFTCIILFFPKIHLLTSCLVFPFIRFLKNRHGSFPVYSSSEFAFILRKFSIYIEYFCSNTAALYFLLFIFLLPHFFFFILFSIYLLYLPAVHTKLLFLLECHFSTWKSCGGLIRSRSTSIRELWVARLDMFSGIIILSFFFIST